MASNIPYRPAGPDLPAQSSVSGGKESQNSPGQLLANGDGQRTSRDKFNVDAQTGGLSFTVPIQTSPGRSGFGPSLNLIYSSGSGGSNGIFGLGWQLSGVESISRQTSRSIPVYDDDRDTFNHSRVGELVPVLRRGDSKFEEALRGRFLVRVYRPRVEADPMRIERWMDTKYPSRIHWRTISSANVTVIYGKTDESRISKSTDETPDAEQTFSWLASEVFDGSGNQMVYEYKKEDLSGVPPEPNVTGRNRVGNSQSNQRYLKAIKYGNTIPNRDKETWQVLGEIPSNQHWMFQVVFDYGEHDATFPAPGDNGQWLIRPDPFSIYNSGFKVRTYRLCRRILMFHNFEELQPFDCLVSSTNFQYVTEKNSRSTLLQSSTVMGHRITAGNQTSYTSLSLPSTEFEYDSIPDLDNLQAERIELGLSGLSSRRAQWVDLNGDGAPGVLVDIHSGGWYYHPNQSTDDETQIGGPSLLPQIPSTGRNNPTFESLNGDGLLDLLSVTPDGSLRGFYKHKDEHWGNFTPFQTYPTISSAVSSTAQQLFKIDLTGDGLVDILQMAPRRDGELTWHQSLGTEGYKEAQLTRGAPMLPMADERGSILLCDMTGDGLTDIVWVGSGNVTFWPNLGHGEFGQRVIMSNAPLLGQEFSTLRIRMADVTGFGGTDMIYIPPQGGAWVYYNQWGNGWSDGHYLSVLPQLDTFCSVDVFDIAGRGTQCLCWTTDYPGYNANAASTTVYFMDLMNGSKPGLLVKGSNGMGSESSVRYRSSIQYYLDDERSGAPWATRLPFSINCVQTITSVDRISHTSSAMQYYYHNGYYDFVDRQFRGFQMVEQRDMEEFATDRPERTFKRPSVVTKSWFFTGLQDLDDISVLPHSLDTQTLKQHILSSAKVQEDITVEEKREAYAALSGQPRRQEIYSEDASAQSSLPYVISQQTYEVVLVQGRSVRLHDTQQRGTFRVNHREEMASNYERKASDMRVQHTLTLKTDDYGNVQRSAIISYGKSESSLPRQEDRQKQMETVIHYTESDYTNPIVDQPDYFQIPVLAEATDYRIYPGLSLQKAIVTQGRYDWEVVAANQCKLFREAADIPIHEDAVEWVRKMGPEGCKALVSKSRTLYYQGDLKAPLPRCKLEPFSIKYQSYQLAFTKALLAKTLRNDQTSFLPEPEAEFQMGGYVNLDGEYEWWAPSHRDSFMDDEGHDELSNARSQFYIPNLTVDQFENKWRRWIDRYNLLFQRSRDAIGNFTSSVHDYACLQPAQVTDENGNTALHASDALGRSVGVAFTGKDNEAVGDSLDNFQSEVDDKDLNELMQNPSGPVAARVLANSGKRTIYALDQYAKHHAPGCSVELVRDTHHRDGPTQISVTITYLNGDGQAIQTVTLQPDGKWLLSGYTIHDHKGQPVRQYLPFFNASHDYHFPDTATVATTILYDGIGRVAGFLNGNQTWSKTRFSPWDQVLFDAGDTILIEKPQNDADIGGLFRCLDSGSYSLPWYYRRINDSSSSDQQKAALKSKQYNDTPKTVHMNAMGKEILTQLDNGPTDPSRIRETRTDYDEHGNISCQMDALGRVVAKTQYDLLGRPLCSSNMDSGKRWQLPDCVGSPHLSWRNGGTRKRIVYDALRRTKQIKLKPSQPSTASEVIVIENVYGEDCEDSSKNNLRGRLYQCRDQSGKQTNNRFDFKGNCCESSVQYAQEYRQLLDWSKGDAILLEPGVYRTGASFDAVGHTLQSKVSNGLKVKRIYDVAGRLTGLDSIDPDGTSTSSVSSVEYTEDGNIASIRYANGSQTTHAYDLVTRKLVNTRITKGNKKTVQDIFYTHDCVGRVIQQADKAQESIYFQNNVVPPVQEFWFDPLGQLTKATGREQVNVADGGQKQLLPHGAAPGRQNALSGNNKYVVQYEEIYQYDCAGNILQTRHAPLSNNEYSGWARKYQYNEPSSIDSAAVSNRLSSTSIGNTVDKYGYDNSEAGRAGCMTSISGYSSLYWDFDNHLSSFSTQRVPGDSIPETAWYIYNSSGRRVRKVTDRATIASQGSSSPSSPNKCKETLYLPLCDIFTTYRGDGSTVIREICTTDLGDPTISRTPIAMLETTKQIQDGTEQSLIRYQMSGNLELDDEGNIVSYEEYSPYGSSTYHVWHSGAPRKYRFASYQRDSESGLYLCGERYYACWIGRWTSADPLGTIAGLNVYCYADNDPVNLEDHKGTCPTRAKRPRMGSEQQPSGSGASSPRTSRGPLAGKKAANGIKGAKETFSKGDFDAAFWSTSNQDIKAKDREQMDGSTSIFRSWQEVHKTPVGVEGLHGCTSLILTSDEGVYFTHWWETRGFSETRPEEGNPKEVPYDHEGEFKSQVLNALEEGRKKGESTHYESLTEHSDMTNVRGYWMTPKEKGSTLYPGKIDEIKAKVEGIIQSEITWVDTSYVPVQNPDDLDEPKNINRLAGQALVTYNPGAEWPVDIFVENRLFQEKR